MCVAKLMHDHILLDRYSRTIILQLLSNQHDYLCFTWNVWFHKVRQLNASENFAVRGFANDFFDKPCKNFCTPMYDDSIRISTGT